MANISITRRCNRGCSYCFAMHEMARDLATDMPPETYEAALGFLKRSGITEVRLLADSDDFVGPDPRQQINQVEPSRLKCNPVVDILPEGDCIVCYALSCFRRFPLPFEGNRNDLVRSFTEELSPMLSMGIYRECACCDYLARRMCDGGCRARRVLCDCVQVHYSRLIVNQQERDTT